MAAIRMGGELSVLVDALQACESALAEARADAEARTPSGVVDLADKHLEQRLTALATNWRATMSKGRPEARAALRALLAAPIQLLPEGDGYRLRGETKLGALQTTPYSWCRGRDSNPHSVATART